VPFAIGAAFFAGGGPVFLAVSNPPLPWVVTQLAGIATCLLCTGAVWIAARAAPVERTNSGAPSASEIKPAA
jgi:hypothetical protein